MATRTQKKAAGKSAKRATGFKATVNGGKRILVSKGKRSAVSTGKGRATRRLRPKFASSQERLNAEQKSLFLQKLGDHVESDEVE